MISGIAKAMKSQILKPTPENYRFCAKVLHEGGLVAFPTGTTNQIPLCVETVYGLGANALNRDAVCDIFRAKDRPFNGECAIITSL